VKYWIPIGLKLVIEINQITWIKIDDLLLLFCPNFSRPGQRPGHLLFHQVIWPGMTWSSAATDYGGRDFWYKKVSSRPRKAGNESEERICWGREFQMEVEAKENDLRPISDRISGTIRRFLLEDLRDLGGMLTTLPFSDFSFSHSDTSISRKSCLVTIRQLKLSIHENVGTSFWLRDGECPSWRQPAQIRDYGWIYIWEI
jgi:hypothetical protein